MMVLALSGSERAESACRDSNVAQFSVMRSMGLSRFGRTLTSACSTLSLGSFRHSASSANPKEASASLYMRCSPALPTVYPNSHMTRSMASGRFEASPGCEVSGEPTISFSYLSQVSVARFSCAACPSNGQASSSRRASTLISSLSRDQHFLDAGREAPGLDPAPRRLDVRREIPVGRIMPYFAADLAVNLLERRR